MAINRWVPGEIPLPPVLERKMLIDYDQIPLHFAKVFFILVSFFVR